MVNTECGESDCASAFSRLRAHGFEADWDFRETPLARWRRRQLVEAVVRRSVRAPLFLPRKTATRKPLWALYFIYSPQCRLDASHRLTLSRLRAQGFSICVVIATGERGKVPDELDEIADAIYWKDLPGYDFSAYALGLRELAKRSESADVLVLNDSVIGPLSDVRDLVTRARWDLTGFSASGRIENHIQSYAFIFKSLTTGSVRRLRTVLFPFIACRDRDDVVNVQEARFARVASRSMSVGAHWFAEDGDPTQLAPFELIEAGHPFFKKSLVEQRSPFPDKQRARDFLADWAGQSE